MTNDALTVHRRLLEVYGEPVWRNPLAPVDELVSTVLSQNTNDTNRDRAFAALKRNFENWAAVRDANPAEVIQAIRPAGLANQKGPRIQEILRAISSSTNSAHAPFDLRFLKDMPRHEARAGVMQFKGVGPKTAAIVLLFSLGVPAFPVDTHIYRVSGRIGLRPAQMSVEEAHAYLEERFPPETYTAAHLNLIRLGREICKARRPECWHCPLQDSCDTVKNG